MWQYLLQTRCYYYFVNLQWAVIIEEIAKADWEEPQRHHVSLLKLENTVYGNKLKIDDKSVYRTGHNQYRFTGNE